MPLERDTKDEISSYSQTEESYKVNKCEWCRGDDDPVPEEDADPDSYLGIVIRYDTVARVEYGTAADLEGYFHMSCRIRYLEYIAERDAVPLRDVKWWLVEEQWESNASGIEKIRHWTVAARVVKEAFLAARDVSSMRLVDAESEEANFFYFAPDELVECIPGYLWAIGDGSIIMYEVRKLGATAATTTDEGITITWKEEPRDQTIHDE